MYMHRNHLCCERKASHQGMAITFFFCLDCFYATFAPKMPKSEFTMSYIYLFKIVPVLTEGSDAEQGSLGGRQGGFLFF